VAEISSQSNSPAGLAKLAVSKQLARRPSEVGNTVWSRQVRERQAPIDRMFCTRVFKAPPWLHPPQHRAQELGQIHRAVFLQGAVTMCKGSLRQTLGRELSAPVAQSASHFIQHIGSGLKTCRLPISSQAVYSTSTFLIAHGTLAQIRCVAIIGGLGSRFALLSRRGPVSIFSHHERPPTSWWPGIDTRHERGAITACQRPKRQLEPL